MSAKQFKIQFGNAKAETVGADTIKALQAKGILHRYQVTELEPKTEAPKPADLTKSSKPADAEAPAPTAPEPTTTSAPAATTTSSTTQAST